MAGTNFDQLIVAGTATLAGNINVCSINGFMPAVGDRFEIMKFASMTGHVTFNGLDIANGIYLQPIFTSTNIVLVATNVPLNASPRLHIARNGAAEWVWWPLGYGEFHLESTTDLNPPVAWSSVTLTETNRSIYDPSESIKFFRMRQP